MHAKKHVFTYANITTEGFPNSAKVQKGWEILLEDFFIGWWESDEEWF